MSAGMSNEATNASKLCEVATVAPALAFGAPTGAAAVADVVAVGVVGAEAEPHEVTVTATATAVRVAPQGVPDAYAACRPRRGSCHRASCVPFP